MKDTLLLIDANSLIHRAFHALPPFTTPDGRPSGALYGLASILIKILRERPFKFGVAAFDHPSPTVREGFYAAYKATRPPPTRLSLKLRSLTNFSQLSALKHWSTPAGKRMT